MAWRDTLLPASFNGIQFKVQDHEVTHGRRLVVNEYPLRDEPYTEDMGRKARRWAVNGYLVGANYTSARDALLAAAESGEVGQLVHPYLGRKTVKVEEIRVRESQRDGGFCEVTFSFVEAGAKAFPTAAPLPNQLAVMRADDLLNVARTLFTGGIRVDGISEYVREAYGESLGDISGVFSAIQLAGGINGQTSISKINQAADWVANLAEIAFPSQTLISDIAGVAGKLISLFGGVLDLGVGDKESGANFARFSDFTTEKTTGTSVVASAINQNAETVERFVRTAAVANETKALVGRDFSYYEEAIEARTAVLQKIDALLESSQNDDEYTAMQAMRREIAAAVPENSETIPRLRNIVIRQSEPALVVAYEQYGSTARADDIVNRNQLRHPGFVPGGVPIQVLSDG